MARCRSQIWIHRLERSGEKGVPINSSSVIEGTIIIHNVDNWKIQLLANCVVIWVMSWCDLQSSRSKFSLNILLRWHPKTSTFSLAFSVSSYGNSLDYISTMFTSMINVKDGFCDDFFQFYVPHRQWWGSGDPHSVGQLPFSLHTLHTAHPAIFFFHIRHMMLPVNLQGYYPKE